MPSPSPGANLVWIPWVLLGLPLLLGFQTVLPLQALLLGEVFSLLFSGLSLLFSGLCPLSLRIARGDPSARTQPPRAEEGSGTASQAAFLFANPRNISVLPGQGGMGDPLRSQTLF